MEHDPDPSPQERQNFPSGRASSGLAILQLLRLPNVFTALADVAMGFLVTQGSLQPGHLFALVAAGSCSLYLAGMVLNDVFDAEVDARERPDRPIPSGRVSLLAANILGWGLLLGGVAVGWGASLAAADWRPGVVATLLGASVVLYDGVLKRTPLAPLLMGACRTLNVLLGMSLAVEGKPFGLAAETAVATPRMLSMAEWMVAAGIGVYIVGVTIFARTEARATSRARLAAGTLVMLAGMGVVASVPRWIDATTPLDMHVVTRGWYLFWAVLAAMIAWRCVVAIAHPVPSRVQEAVRNAVQSIIVLDAAVCVGLVGPIWGLAILALLAPTYLLTQWLKAT
jgi:4-hydroxybenzoate polyprenyltransferase